MSAYSFVLFCGSCGKPQRLFISGDSPEELLEENKRLQSEAFYLGQRCESLSDRLAVAEAMAAWDNPDGISVADLLG